MKNKPCLIVVFGLPGSGKSTVSKALSGSLSAVHFNTDIIRKRQGLIGDYDPDAKERVYQSLYRYCEEKLDKDEIVIVDGTFHKQTRRDRLKDLTLKMKIPIYFIKCISPPPVIKERVSHKREDSEADYSVYELIQKQFEPVVEEYLELDTSTSTPEACADKIVEYIRNHDH